MAVDDHKPSGGHAAEEFFEGALPLNEKQRRMRDRTGIDDPRLIHEEILMPSTLETIDNAVNDLIDGGFNLSVEKKGVWEKVPVIWNTSERSFHIKNNQDLRNKNGIFTLPVITIERTGTTKDLGKRGGFPGNMPRINDEKGGSIVIARRIQQDKTTNFAASDARRLKGQINFPRKNKKIVYQTITAPQPIFIEVTYGVVLRTEYQQQMNDLMAPFITTPNALNLLRIGRDGHIYDAFIQSDFSFDNNISNLSEEERKFQTKVEIKVLGYLMGAGKNDKRPRVAVRESIVDVKIPRERVITGDINRYLDKDGFYRE